MNDSSFGNQSPVEVNELIQKFLSYLSVLDVKRAACTCRQWHTIIKTHFDLNLLLVTVGGANELALVSASTGHVIQRFSAAAARRKRKRLLGASSPSSSTTYCWPTCLAIGPDNQLFISQYKVQGVLEFKRSPGGYSHRRTLASGRALTSPEGLVVAHNSLYVVSVANATVSRVSLHTGDVLEETGPFHQEDENVWTLWGMCTSPAERSLLIAGHRADGEDYRTPTPNFTGRILRLDLAPDGSFERRLHRRSGQLRCGYYVEPISLQRSADLHGRVILDTPLRLNRPSDPQFCSHGILHVSTFVSGSDGPQRRIEKFTCRGYPWNGGDDAKAHEPKSLGWLEAETGLKGASGSYYPWGIAFSQSTNEVYVSCIGPSPVCVVKLATCGCENVLGQMSGSPHAIPCGKAAVLVDNGDFDQPNYVLSID